MRDVGRGGCGKTGCYGANVSSVNEKTGNNEANTQFYKRNSEYMYEIMHY